jgi:DNA-binding MarR family transcriptional regulator
MLSERIERHGVVPGQFAQLLALYERDGQTPTELSRAVRIEPGTMTKTLQRMARDGLIERRPDATDRRAVRIYLTAHARELEPTLKAEAGTINAVLTSGMSERRVRELLRDIATLIGRAERILADG